MPQDTVHHAGISNKADDSHRGAAGAKEGIGLEDFLNQASQMSASIRLRETPFGLPITGKTVNSWQLESETFRGKRN